MNRSSGLVDVGSCGEHTTVIVAVALLRRDETHSSKVARLVIRGGLYQCFLLVAEDPSFIRSV